MNSTKFSSLSNIFYASTYVVSEPQLTTMALRRRLRHLSSEAGVTTTTNPSRPQSEKRPNTHPDLYDERWRRELSQSRIGGLPIDPHTLFVYWYTNQERRALIAQHFMSNWESLPFCVCLYDVTQLWFDGYNAPLLQRIRVDAQAENWYFRGLEPDRNYVVDLAVEHDEALFCILRSEVIALPPAKSILRHTAARFIRPLGQDCEKNPAGHGSPRADERLCLRGEPSAHDAQHHREESPISRYESHFDGYHLSH